MTLYTHAIVGLGLGRVCIRRRLPVLFWALAALLPTVPDFDALSFQPYGSIWGHRGWTHSLSFALVLGVITAAVTFRYFKMKFWLLAGLFFAITASHAVLDALTIGGFGIPFFWPFSSERFVIWGLVPLPIGMQWPDPWKYASIRGELLWVWLPTIALVAGVSVCRYFRRWRSARQRAEIQAPA
jgi:inner membrane protein